MSVATLTSASTSSNTVPRRDTAKRSFDPVSVPSHVASAAASSTTPEIDQKETTTESATANKRQKREVESKVESAPVQAAASSSSSSTEPLQRTYILITGSRDWSDHTIISSELALLPSDAIIVHGGCRGADLIAAQIWKEKGGDAISVPAEWSKFGRAAGPIRNKKMLDSYPIKSAVAFRKGASAKGTKNMVDMCKKKGVPVKERWVE